MQIILKQQLLSLGSPEDDYQHHIFLSPLQLHKNSKLHTKLSLLIEKYVQETKGQRGSKQLERLRCHWQWVLLGTVEITGYQCWLLVSPKKEHIRKKTSGCNVMTSNTPAVKAIVDYLEAQGLIKVLKGKKVKRATSRTRLFQLAFLVVRFGSMS
jgi:hypothetical protein